MYIKIENKPISLADQTILIVHIQESF
jgi:hypothetical protein